MTPRPEWWPTDRLGVPGRYVVSVVSDGERYGFKDGGAARAFFSRLECSTEKVAVFRDLGRAARGRGRRRGIDR